MQGIVFDIKRFAVHDGPGIRTTIFLKGCPLSCQWCHNPESLEMQPCTIEKHLVLNGRQFTDIEVIGYETTIANLLAEIDKEQVFMEESAGGVTFSGGEPLLQYAFLEQLLESCHNKGIHTAVDTSLLASWDVVERIASKTDLLLVDLKLMDDNAHQTFCGVSNKLILENIVKLAAKSTPMRIRIPIIPGVTDTQINIENSITFLRNIKGNIIGIDLLPFHNSAKEKYKRINLKNEFSQIPSLNKSDLQEIKNTFEAAGFNVKIGG